MKKNETELHIQPPQTGNVTLFIKGKTPFYCNRPSQKAKFDLLIPKKKTAAEKATTLKHLPIEEYRNSPYKHIASDQGTRIYFPVGGFKKAMMTAALETEGAKKASIARLLWIEGTNVNLYGVQQMAMDVVRNADPNHTPDIRSRAVLPVWAAKLEITYIQPKLNAQMVANLLSGAGLMVGVGDWRQEKGSGNNGQFVICNEEEYEAIVAVGGREAQDAALENPAYFNDETATLMAQYTEEVARRMQGGDAAAQNSRRRRKQFTDGSEAMVDGPVEE